RRPLIIGSGIAGLYVGVRSRELGLHPTLVTKGGLEESNTRYAQGGIAAAIGPGDSPALHLADTVRAGAGLVDEPAARHLVNEAPARIADLVRMGVPFDAVEGQVSLGREAAHSRARILHAGGDATGLLIEEALKRRATELGLEVRERSVLRSLDLGPGGLTVTLSDPDGRDAERVEPTQVVLATGGAGSLFRESSNPPVATGEGIVLAARAGALLADMEFVQFHPTVFLREGAPRYLLSEALRGEGALLVNSRGERFMPRYHRDAELAPRDVVSRAILSEIERTRSRSVFLDATALPRDRLFARFPTICRFLAEYGLDPSRDRLPVTPAAHFLIGGVATDVEGRSTLPGLLACGEAAATGVHGANRLASNSLLEGVVFGEHVVRQLLRPSPGGPEVPGRVLEYRPAAPRGRVGRPPDATEVRRRLWEQVGIIRNATGLRQALRRFERGASAASGGADAAGTALLALAAALIARSALERTESRGVHYRSDFPKTATAWRRHSAIRLLPPRRRELRAPRG
ncbi:MAG TPA: L-aspartate oxidase, partial [Thermoplasmata archaeon]|nr:L-aspartate oxidase [Thermoplasmata archaeon]